MKIIITPMVLKLKLVLVFILLANVLDTNGQTTSELAPQKENIGVNVESAFQLDNTTLSERSTANYQSAPKSGNLRAPYNCESGLVYILTNDGSSNGNVTGLYTYNLATNTQTLIKNPLIPSSSSSQFINAIGYNILDNYLYGILQGTNQVVKMDDAGTLEFLTITGDFKLGSYAAGDIDKNGVLFVYGENKFISINLNPSASNYLVANTLLSYSTTVNDIAFSPIDDNVYMMTSNSSRRLLRYNVTSNTVTDLGAISGLASEGSNSFGTAFMDSMGNMFVSNNASGNIYKIASPHTGGLTATAFNSLTGTPGDGARCPNQAVAPNAVKDQACLSNGQTITIDLLQNDGAGTYPINLASVQLIDPSTNAASSTVTVSGQGTFTVNGSGILTFTPAASFTEASIKYSIADTTGLISNQATISVSTNTTAAPTGASVQEFCALENPTVANLSASGNAIAWYSDLASTTPLVASASLLDGTTYYSTQTSSSGCESLSRLAVTVNFIEGLALVNPESLSCTNSKTAYIITATFKGTAPFIANGTGAPGQFTDNGDQTTTWISSPIGSTIATYNVKIQGDDTCGILDLSGSAPLDCLAVPFDCTDGLAFIITNTGTSESNYVSGFHTLNLTTNVQTLIKDPLVEASSTSRFINGIGYNTKDSFLYGLLQSTNKIVRIDAKGDVEYFDIKSPFTTGFYSSGDMNNNGILYLHSGKKFVAVNLDPLSPNYLTSTDLLDYTIVINDLAYNAIDNSLYMMTSTENPKLFRYDLASNTVIDLGFVSGLEAETTNSYGTAFFDSVGNLFVANNSSGLTYKISSPHTGGVTASFYSAAMQGLQPGDGARCQDQISLPVANDDTACGLLETDTVIDVLANDGEGSYALNLSSVQLIDPITETYANTVTVAGQGTFTVGANGMTTFTPLATFTEASVTYTMRDIVGNVSQPATITVSLDIFEIVCPTFPSLDVACYDELPSATTYSIQEFEALGNGDGRIGESTCGVIEITASNSSDEGTCSQTITRTYSITKYQDTNNNGFRDNGENTILNTAECVQLINIADVSAPTLVGDYETEIAITCESIPEVPALEFEDGCSNNINVVFEEVSTATDNLTNYQIVRTWTVSDTCDNDAVFKQTINVNIASTVVGIDSELCNNDDIDFDLFNLLSGTFTRDGLWSVESGTATLDGSIFNPYLLQLGTYTFKYTTTDNLCATETLVNISLNDDCVVLPCGSEDVVISKTVTANNDNINEFFAVTGVETCGFTVEIQIYNRWGALIYESKDYQNDWNGTASSASIGSSNFVPTGTYYYIVNLKNSGLKPFAGPIYVATK
ncbi:DUF6923 family protein [Gelidibacter algens]|nr:gliding motility-associated C-terminal domain-containing protein [Gelidibacter algens]OBX25050.1 hypothetical protein A9996_12185 [Gelidibacter algens]